MGVFSITAFAYSIIEMFLRIFGVIEYSGTNISKLILAYLPQNENRVRKSI